MWRLYLTLVRNINAKRLLAMFEIKCRFLSSVGTWHLSRKTHVLVLLMIHRHKSPFKDDTLASVWLILGDGRDDSERGRAYDASSSRL